VRVSGGELWWWFVWEENGGAWGNRKRGSVRVPFLVQCVCVLVVTTNTTPIFVDETSSCCCGFLFNFHWLSLLLLVEWTTLS